MKLNVEGFVAIVRRFDAAHDKLEAMRRQRIRESDILRDGPALNEAFRSAKFLGNTKPVTGLVHLRDLLTKMNR